MLYYYILSFVCYAYWLLLYLEETNKQQQYISLLRTKWKFDIKYLLSNYQSTTWLFITTF